MITLDIKKVIRYDDKTKSYWVQNRTGGFNIYVEAICENCGRRCYVSKTYVQQKKSLFCSIKCGKAAGYRIKSPLTANIMNLQHENSFYYLVGLIATDGTVQYPGSSKKCNFYNVCVELQKKDSDVLYKIKEIFGGNINETNGGTSVKWYCRNQCFIIYLRDIVGITARKSITLNINREWFKQLTLNQQNAFLRGCYDGDGAVFCNPLKKKQGKYISISTSSSKFKKFLIDIFKEKNFNLHVYSYLASKHKTHILTLYGREALKAFKDIFMIGNTPTILRKTEKYLIMSKYYSLEA